MTQPDDPLLAGVLATIGDAAQSEKRSELYLWLKRNHDQLATSMRSGLGEDGWIALTAKLADAGLTDKLGKPPTVHTARKTWALVREDVRRERAAALRAEPFPPPEKRPRVEITRQTITHAEPVPPPAPAPRGITRRRFTLD